MKKTKVTSNYLYNVAYQILTFITPIITSPYLARYFGSESLGIYNYTYSIVYWFILFGMLGLGIYGNRQIAKVRDSKKQRSKTFCEIFLLQVINILTSTIIFYIAFNFFGQEYHDIFLLQGLMIIASLFDISWFYNGIENFKKITIRNFFVKILTIILMIMIIKNPDQVVEYVWINIGMTFFSNIVMWVNLNKYIDFVKVSIKDAYKHFKKTFLLFLPQIATSLYSIFTQTMIGFLYSDISDVAFYNQAYKLITMCLSITTTMGTVMLPHIVNAKAKEGDAVVKKSTNKTLKIALFVSIPLAVGIGICAPSFIPWFLTEEFNTVGYLLSIMAAVIIFISITNVTGTQYLLSLERDKDYTTSLIAGSVINVILNIFLISMYGAIGAAISTLITEFLVLTIQFIMVRKTFNFSGVIHLGIRYLISASIMGIILFAIGTVMGATIFTTILQFIIGVLIYFIIMFAIKDEIFIFILEKVKDLFGLKLKRR